MAEVSLPYDKLWLIAGGIASICDRCWIIRIFVWIQRWVMNRPFREVIPITSPEVERVFRKMERQRGRVIKMDAMLDFSISSEEHRRIWCYFDFDELFEGDRLRNAARIPILSAKFSTSDRPSSLDSLRVVINDHETLRVSKAVLALSRFQLAGLLKSK